MSKDNNRLSYNYRDLMQLQNSTIAIINGSWESKDEDKDINKSIKPTLEFKLSILHKLASENLVHYEEQRLNILKKYVNLDDKGNFKFKETDDGEDITEKPIEEQELDWKSKESNLEAELEIAEVFKEKIDIQIPLKINSKEFVNKNDTLLPLNGIGYGLSDFITFDD